MNPKVLVTPSGIRFGLLGERGSTPAPTLFVFANRIEETLGSEHYSRSACVLMKHGFLCASLDLPCHGEDKKPGEPDGLGGWRVRVVGGDELVPGFVAKVSAVLDYLVKEGYADPQKVAACGTSRGGFMALHFAAADARVKCVAAFAPVSDLLTLREFAGMEQHPVTNALALVNLAEKLAGRGVWVCIGNHDERVGTDHAIAFTRKVVEACAAQKRPADVELHVMPVAGHTLHATAHEEAAAWMLARMIKT